MFSGAGVPSADGVGRVDALRFLDWVLAASLVFSVTSGAGVPFGVSVAMPELCFDGLIFWS